MSPYVQSIEVTTHPKKPTGGIKGISERILKNAMVYLVDNDEDEFSDKHKISLFDDSKFEEAGNTTLDEINRRGKHHKEEDSLDQSNLLIKQKLNIPSGSSSEHGDDEEDDDDDSSDDEAQVARGVPTALMAFDRDSMVLVGENVLKYTKKKKFVEPVENNGCLLESEDE